MNTNYYFSMLPGADAEELVWLQELTKNYNDETRQRFIAIYSGRRKDPQTVLICCLIGFVGFAGIQRFLTDQIGWGIAYLLTLGFCYVGTIIDVINYKQIAWEYNKKEAMAAAALLGYNF
ncbi:TM2 domain-containing protein [Chitinophaga horti]|uniref:TM2 domain-containing protein n=1 Tax=Chitinophaga horti TaxID=2920382 RepID=A0ABY6J3F2_9BACT|nr:TM2 domain-containing protein [Chitinophaga horti]UYQ92717.1 TM2 domain-containing protein [Chitinophaga horti]